MEALKENNAKLATKGHCTNYFQLFQDLSLEEKITKAEILIEEQNHARREIVQAIEERKFEQNDLQIQLCHLRWEYGMYGVDMRTKAIQHLQQVLHQLHLQELENIEHTIKMNRLFHQVQHGRNSLVEERRISGAIKSCADERREKLLIDSNTKGKHQRYPSDIREVIKSKELIKEQIQLLFREQGGLRKQILAYHSKEKMLKNGLEDADKKINSLKRKLEDVNRRKLELYNYILELKK